MSQPANPVTMKIMKSLNRVRSIILIPNQFSFEGCDHGKKISILKTYHKKR
jgi:hypothetical protein